MTDDGSQTSHPQQIPNQEPLEATSNDEANEEQGERSQPSEAQGHQQPDLCGICDVARRNAICTPCGHQAGCVSCLKTIMRSSKACPICRMPVRSILKVY